MIEFLLAWYLPGIVSFLLCCYVFDKKIDVIDLFASVLFGLLGWIFAGMLVVGSLCMIVKNYGSKTLLSRK